MRGNAHAPKPRTAKDRETAAMLFIHQHPSPERITVDQLVRLHGVGEKWAEWQVALVRQRLG